MALTGTLALFAFYLFPPLLTLPVILSCFFASLIVFFMETRHFRYPIVAILVTGPLPPCFPSGPVIFLLICLVTGNLRSCSLGGAASGVPESPRHEVALAVLSLTFNFPPDYPQLLNFTNF